MNASFWNYPSKQKSWPIDEEMESLGEVIHPLDNIGGFDVRPGFYQMNGAYQTEEGVSFTVSSHGATSCVLLLFRPAAQEPYARIRIPESYKIGNTYSILVFGLKAEDFEYAYQMDGPADQARGLLFNRNIRFLIHMRKLLRVRETGEKNRKAERILSTKPVWCKVILTGGGIGI